MPKFMISSYRPFMLLHDSMRHAETKELKERRLDREFMKNHALTDGHKAFMHSWASADFDPVVAKEMEVIRADALGNFTTEDPMMAYYIVQQLSSCPEVNKPDQNKTPVKYEVNPLSDPIPTKEEYEAMKAKLEKSKEASKAK